MRLKSHPPIRFAGQITGVEGYVESAAMGLMAGRFAALEAAGKIPTPPPETTAFGALISHITGGADAKTFQPMNVNYGLLPPIEVPKPTDGKRLRGKEKGRARKTAMSHRALQDLDAWLNPASVAAD